MKVAGSDKVVVEKTFIQLHPDWTDGGFGWEQIENDPEVAWGFLWNRVVTYEGRGSYWVLFYIFDMYFIDQYIARYNASAYVTRKWLSVETTVDYRKLNNLDDLKLSSVDGLENTVKLYNFGGAATTGAIENALNSLSAIKIKSSQGDNNMTSAALGYVLKKNKYNLLKIEKKDGSNIQIAESVLIDVDNIKWFLPAKDQLLYPPIQGDPWIGEYWSSTPDENSEDNKIFTSSGSAGRMEVRKIRACCARQ